MARTLRPDHDGYLATLSHLMSMCCGEWELLRENPCKAVRKPKENPGRNRYLSDAERMRLLDECRVTSSWGLLPLVVTAISTGARKGELLALDWREVDLDRAVLTFRHTKNGESRVVPVSVHVDYRIEGVGDDLLQDVGRDRINLPTVMTVAGARL